MEINNLRYYVVGAVLLAEIFESPRSAASPRAINATMLKLIESFPLLLQFMANMNFHDACNCSHYHLRFIRVYPAPNV